MYCDLNVLVEIQSYVESNTHVVTNMHRTCSKSFGQQLLVMTKHYRRFASKKEVIKSDSKKKVKILNLRGRVPKVR